MKTKRLHTADDLYECLVLHIVSMCVCACVCEWEPMCAEAVSQTLSSTLFFTWCRNEANTSNGGRKKRQCKKWKIPHIRARNSPTPKRVQTAHNQGGFENGVQFMWKQCIYKNCSQDRIRLNWKRRYVSMGYWGYKNLMLYISRRLDI